MNLEKTIAQTLMAAGREPFRLHRESDDVYHVIDPTPMPPNPSRTIKRERRHRMITLVDRLNTNPALYAEHSRGPGGDYVTHLPAVVERAVPAQQLHKLIGNHLVRVINEAGRTCDRRDGNTDPSRAFAIYDLKAAMPFGFALLPEVAETILKRVNAAPGWSAHLKDNFRIVATYTG